MRLMRFFTLAILLLVAGPALADDFPLRAQYPGVPPISLSDLDARFADVVVVDVRSKLEFDTIHVADSVHLPLKDQGFPAEARALQTARGGKTLVFYCNGIDCPKSYDAVAMCQKAGLDNVKVFDTGIFEWAKARPERTVLLGRTPADPSKLISGATLKAHLVSYPVAREKAASGMAIDIRNPMHRSFIPDLPRLRNIPLDALIPMLAEGKFKDQQLVLIDPVGKQVQWLQYWLEDHGYTNYVFVEHGVEAAKQTALAN
jgi:rhodanese-related sulfurtransferase